MVTLHLKDEVIKSLSNHELNILKYVYAHTDQILNMSIHEMAKEVSYSTATILRFCKKLGYSGFAEFKYTLRMEARREPGAPAAQKQEHFSTSILVEQICSNVEATSRLLQEEQIFQVIEYFDSSRRIYIWAPGGITSILAEYFEKILMSAGRQDVYLIASVKMGEHILRTIPENSMWIIISTTGSFEPAIRLGKLSRMNNVPVISITPYTNNAVAQLATVSFRFFTVQRERQGAEFTSRLPVFYVIRMIMYCYLNHKRREEASIPLAADPGPSGDSLVNLADPSVLSGAPGYGLPAAVDTRKSRQKNAQLPLFEKAHGLELTDTEKEILDYFEGGSSRRLFQNINQVSRELYTSNATIVRFCKKLGLRGYNEFKYQVRRELEQLEHPEETMGSLLTRSAARFRDNVDSLDARKLEQIADILTSDRSIYIYGANLSSMAAKYLYIILTTLDYPSILVEWWRLLKGLVEGMDDNTVLFMISAHGDARRYLPVLEEARRRRAITILLTCQEDSPLIPYCTISLCTNDENEEYRHVDVNARQGILTIIQILIEMIARKKEEGGL